MKLLYKAATHQGRRGNNEDAFGLEPELGLFLVADGMGGYEGGEVASRLAVDTIGAFFRLNARDRDITWPHSLDRGLSFTANMLSVAVRMAHEGIVARKQVQYPRMGTTVAALVLHGREATIAHVGDSRVYRLRGGDLHPLTRDHSLYEELVRSGTEVPDRASCPFSNVITRALGMEGALPELRTEAVDNGDLFLLCTDGILERLDDDTIRQELVRLPPQQSCPALVRRAYDAGGRDNITAVVIQVEG